MIAAHTPPGGNVSARTRMFMQKLISHYYPKSEVVDEADLPVCAWDDATGWVYADTSHAIVINSQVTPLHYGMRVSADLAREIRAAGLHIVPINDALPSAVLPLLRRQEAVASEPLEPIKSRGRSPKRRPATAGA
jgi:hypothetical protein